MACITKRKKRKRECWVVDWRDGAGRRRAKFFGTKREAEHYLSDVLREMKQPARPVVDTAITVAEYAARWEQILAAQVKPRTLESYTDTLRLHIVPALGSVRVRELHRGRVKALLAAKLESGLAR